MRHSEFNPSAKEPRASAADLDRADVTGIEPGYEEKHFDVRDRGAGSLRLIASRDGRDGSVKIHQDADGVRRARERRRKSQHSLLPGARRTFTLRAAAPQVNGQVRECRRCAQDQRRDRDHV